MSAPTAVFDLDGTFVDTAPDILASLNHVLASIGAQQADLTSLRQFVGRGARVALQRALSVQSIEMAPEEEQRLTAMLIDHYTANIPGLSKPFEGVMDFAYALKQDGFLLAICTNKLEHMARKLLKAMDLDRDFAAICGSDSFAFRKPDPLHVTKTIVAAGGEPHNAVMIGDMVNDVDAAKAANIPVLGFTGGYSPVSMESLQPTQMFSHYSDLSPSLCRKLIQSNTIGGQA